MEPWDPLKGSRMCFYTRSEKRKPVLVSVDRSMLHLSADLTTSTWNTVGRFDVGMFAVTRR